jgi:hypothetical protein
VRSLSLGFSRDGGSHVTSSQLPLGNAVHAGNDVGHASALDSALLVVMWGALFGAVQGVAISEAEQLRLDAYSNYLKPILPLSAFLDKYAAMKTAGSLFEHQDASVETCED